MKPKKCCVPSSKEASSRNNAWKNIVNFNQVVQDLPKKTIPNNGPRIIFGSQIGPIKYVKLLYNIQIPSWNTYKLIIEYLNTQNFTPNTITTPKIRAYYYSQAT